MAALEQVSADMQFATAVQLVQTRFVVAVQAADSKVSAAQVVAHVVQLATLLVVENVPLAQAVQTRFVVAVQAVAS